MLNDGNIANRATRQAYDTKQSSRLIDAALALAGAGLPVFPCGQNKQPLVHRGFLDATTDPAIVVRMFAKSYGRLIGVPTGPASGVDVLDLDYRHGAAPWEVANAVRLPETRVHETQSGGRHMLFRAAPGVRNSAGRIGLGVDVRGGGGYVIMPPSPGYRVIHETPIAAWPSWLLTPGLALPKAKPAPVIGVTAAPLPARLEGYRRAVLARVRAAVDGQKHTALRNAGLALGGIAAQAGFTDQQAVDWLIAALPASVANWDIARRTADWSVAAGRDWPIELEDRAWGAR